VELGIDPGRAKVGFVFVEGESLLASGVVPKAFFGDFVRIVAAQSWRSLAPWLLEGDASSLEGRRIGVIVIGGGTGAEDVRAELERAGFSVVVVEEAFSTLEARSLYWKLHPPRGWRRIIPLSLLVPPRDLDDIAAWVLVLRFRASSWR